MRPRTTALVIALASIAWTFGLFQVTQAYFTPLWQVEIRPSLSVRYRGAVVTEHDTHARTIRIAMPSSFVGLKPPADILFTYDEETRWGSITVGFEDDYATTFTQSDLTTTAPTLQPGTFVTVSKDMRRMEENRAASVVFLRRVEI